MLVQVPGTFNIFGNFCTFLHIYDVIIPIRHKTMRYLVSDHENVSWDLIHNMQSSACLDDFQFLVEK